MFQFRSERLHVKQILGKGRFGKVFPYQKDPQDLKWVVKRIRVDDADELIATLPEIVLGFACDHPCVVPVKGYFIEKSSDHGSFNIYIKFPRMKASFQDEFRSRRKSDNPYSEEEIIRHFYSLACGIGYLHSKKIYHGDIKPDNLLLSESGDLKIADIGIAKHVEDEDSYQTLTGTAGTYHYSAPEIFCASRKETKKHMLEKADVWSIGIVILELCIFSWKLVNALSPQEKLQENLDELIKRLDGKYSKSLITLIKKSLSIDPEKRTSIQEIKGELEMNFAQILDQDLLNLEKSVSSRVNDSAEDKIRLLNQQIKEITEEYEFEIKQLKEMTSQLESALIQQKQQHEKRIKVLVGQSDSKAREEFSKREAINKDLEAKIKCLEQELRKLKEGNNKILSNSETKEKEKLNEEKGHFWNSFKGLFQPKVKVSESPKLGSIDFRDKYEEKLKIVVLELNQELGQLFVASKEKENLKIQHNGEKWLINENMTDEHLTSLSNSLITLLQKNNLSHLSGLEIDCWGCTKLTDGAFLYLIKTLHYPAPYLQSLTLSFAWCKQFTDDISVDLSLLLSNKLSQLKYLTLDFRRCQQLSDKALLELSLALSSQFLCLESLNLDYGGCKKLTERALVELFHAITSQSLYLQHLSLNFGGCEIITDESFARLKSTFINLRTLNLNFASCKELTDQALVYLASSIDNQLLYLQHLSLDFSGCTNLTDKGLKRVAMAISNQSSDLQNLNFNFYDCKELTDEVLADLAAALNNKSLFFLQNLGLDFRSIPNLSDNGVSALSTAIEKNLKSLRQLKLTFSKKGKISSQMKQILQKKFEHISKLEIV